MLPYVRNLLLLAAFAGGWLIHGWFSDSLELVANKAAQASAQEAAGVQLKAAELLQTELSRLSVNEKTIIRENVKLVDRPVYHNLCLDPDGLRNANAAKNGFFPAAGVPKP
jgi:hypothetical protein